METKTYQWLVVSGGQQIPIFEKDIQTVLSKRFDDCKNKKKDIA